MAKLVVISIVGICLSLLLNRNMGATGITFVSNMLFVTAMCFILLGLMQLVSNIGLFNGFVFGTRSLIKLIRSKQETSESLKEEYLQYVESRKKFKNISQLIIIGAGFMALSILVSFI